MLNKFRIENENHLGQLLQIQGVPNIQSVVAFCTNVLTKYKICLKNDDKKSLQVLVNK